MSEQPQTFGKYQLVRKIGTGGFGEVWQAYDPQTKSKVALKVLHQGLMSDASFVTKAQNEALLTRKIDHPNVVKVYETGEVAGRLYIAMQYIDGQPLSEMIKAKRPFTIPQVVTLVGQVASALDATHAKGIVHRDVKPANILIDANGSAHLVDFGLAHAAQSSLGQSASSVGMGTAMYMSPEQASGQKGDRTTDVYSLGVIAYELLAGQPPFQADTMMGFMMAHKDQPPPLPSKFNSNISADIQKVLLKALSKEPSKRYKTAGIFASTLQKAASRPFRKAGQSSRTGCIVVPIALVLIIAVAVGAVALGAIKLPPDIAKVIGLVTPTAVVQAPAQPTQPKPATNAPAPTNPPAAQPTAAPAATSEPAPVVASQPTDTPIPQPTDVPTAVPQPGDGSQLIGTGVSIQLQGNSATRLVVNVRDGFGQPIGGAYIRMYSQKKDLSGHWVVDREIKNGNTDNSGSVAFDLSPDHYIVRADFTGYNWGTAGDVKGQADVPIEVGQTTQLNVALSRLTVGFLKGDNSVISGKYVRIWLQKKDLAGNWVRDDEVANGNTDNTGIVGFNLTPGYYIVGADLPGYNWGTAYDVKGMASVALTPGQENRLVIKLGQLIVGLIDSTGKPINGQYVRVYTQQLDAAGKPATADEVANGNTDNTGAVTFDLTPGKYAVRINDQITYNVGVEPGRITSGDGTKFEMKP